MWAEWAHKQQKTIRPFVEKWVLVRVQDFQLLFHSFFLLAQYPDFSVYMCFDCSQWSTHNLVQRVQLWPVHASSENVTTFPRDLSFINMSIAQIGALVSLCNLTGLFQIDFLWFPFRTQLIELFGWKRDVDGKQKKVLVRWMTTAWIVKKILSDDKESFAAWWKFWKFPTRAASHHYQTTNGKRRKLFF